MPARNLAVLIGSVTPDLPLYGLFAWTKIMGIPEDVLWGQIYWSPPWPVIMGAGHSFIVLGTILIIGLWMWQRSTHTKASALSAQASDSGESIGEIIACFAAAALIHALADFPLHVDDNHMQFWPVSDYKFRSPVSYWDPDHNGTVWSIIEALIGIICAVVLWRRFPQWWVRALCAFAILLYVAVPVYFAIILGHAGH